MGITQTKWHKRKKTSGRRNQFRKKRKSELGRPAANTKLAPARVHKVRVMGGNFKHRALRMDIGNFSWGSEAIARKTRLIDVVYDPSNNEHVRTKTLVKGGVVSIDSTPFRQWFESYYATPLGRKKGAKLTDEEKKYFDTEKKTGKARSLYNARKKWAHVEQHLEDQFPTGRILAKICSSPGQVGRVDGVVLEGRELEFYLKKLRAKKNR